MQIVLIVIGVLYVVFMPILFVNWLEFFRYEVDSLTGKERQISVISLAIATLFWPLVLPCAYLELLDKLKRSNRVVRIYQRILETPQTSFKLLEKDVVSQMSQYD
jgi:hypothetical protein